LTIEVWEKARGPGGRMSTNRQELNGAMVRADMGAQYLSLDSADKACAEVADMLVKEGACSEVPASVLSSTPERPSGESWKHLVGASGGVNDALKVLLGSAEVEPHYEKRVASLDAQQGHWRARPFDGSPGMFDAVVIAVPGCGVGGDNLNKIRGSWENVISAEQNKQLQAVEHDHRWSFALYLPLDCSAKCEAFFGPSAVEKVVDDGTMHMLCYQSRKVAQATNTEPAGALVVIAHTTLAWAKRNARASGRDERLLKEISERVASVLGLPGPISRLMLGSKVITWKQSQVTSPIPLNAAVGPCMLLSTQPPLLLAGDYFTESNFGGCLRSGFGAADLLAKILKGDCPPAIIEAAANGDRDSGGKGTKRQGEGNKGKAGGEAGKGYSSRGKGDKGGDNSRPSDSNWQQGGWEEKGGGGKSGNQGGKRW